MTRPLTSKSVRDYPFGDRADLDVHPRYAELRAQDPVVRVRMPYGGEAWLLTRYEDVRRALADPRLSLHAAADRDVPRAAARPNDSNGLMSMRRDDHSRLRRIVSKAFTARRVARMRPDITAIAGDLVDRMVAGGSPADIVRHLALPLPTTVVCRLLGVPETDQGVFRRFGDALMSSTRCTQEEIAEATRDFGDYLRDLAAARRAEPQDDLLSALLQVSDTDGSLTEQELLMLTGGLLLGGHETTANQLSGHILLLRRRSRYERLSAEPELIPNAVEELLRFFPPAGRRRFQPGRHRRRGDGRRRHSGRRCRRLLHHLGQPGRRGVRRTRRTLPGTSAQPAPHVRPRAPLLHGCALGQAGNPVCARNPRQQNSRAASRRTRERNPMAQRNACPRCRGDSRDVVNPAV